MTDKPLSILLVDDEEQILVRLKPLLELSGFQVMIAHNGRDALNKIQKSNFHAVVSDIEMPQMDGLELLTEIRNSVVYSLPVILMTGYLDADYAVEAIRKGASDFIRKPIDTKQLIKSVNKVVSANQISQQIQNMAHRLSCVEMEFHFYPKHFLETDITSTITVMFQQYFELEMSYVNEITLCLEEMLNNAFIHGTLNMENKTRQLDHVNYQAFIQKAITHRDISSKKITLQVKLDKVEKFLQIVVTDEGKGFLFNPWLERSREDLQKNLTSHGRGIGLIKLLVDDVQFLNEGRTIMIRKKIEYVKKDLPEIQ